MSRSSKKKKKQQKMVMAAVLFVAVAAMGVCLFLFRDKIFDKKEASPDGSELINISVKPGDGSEKNKKETNENKDNYHEVPYWLDQYFGGDKENPILSGKDPYKEQEEREKEEEKKQEEEEQKKKEEEKKNSSESKESTSSDKKKEETPSSKTEKSGEGYLEVHFIDVGQGDSILAKFVDTNLENGDDSAAMLIDAGDNKSGTNVRNYIGKQGAKELLYFVCTHPDADHIGGAASVVSNVPITSEIVWGPDYTKDTKTYHNLMNEISNKSYTYEAPKIGEVYDLGLASFQFVAPTESHKDVNSNSLVMLLWYEDDSFLLVGDCEEEEELEIIEGKYKKKIAADVLKVGHHGSKTSTSEDFLKLVNPTYAVISVGEGNSYYHPHAAALNNLRSAGVELFRTDVQGSLVATTYGSGIMWNASPCNDWTVGE